MFVVWKYTTDPRKGDTVHLRTPMGATFMCVQNQGEAIATWWRIPLKDGQPSSGIHIRTLQIVGTGHPTHLEGQYLGTVQLAGGRLVLHVFEV